MLDQPRWAMSRPNRITPHADISRDSLLLLKRLLVLQASRLIRYLPFFVKHPNQIRNLPAVALYLYVYQVVRVYSFFTIGNVCSTQSTKTFILLTEPRTLGHENDFFEYRIVEMCMHSHSNPWSRSRSCLSCAISGGQIVTCKLCPDL